MMYENLIHDPSFYCKVEEWNNLNNCAVNIEEAITTLSEMKRDYSWTISHLVSDLVKTVEARTRALDEMKPYGVENSLEAVLYACKMITRE